MSDRHDEEEVTMEISSLAAELIATHQRRSPSVGAFRIRRDADHDVADGLRVGFTDQAMPNDTVVTSGDARILVAEDAEPLVDALTIDAKFDGSAYRLVLRDG
jgi:hypothetical protein